MRLNQSKTEKLTDRMKMQTREGDLDLSDQ